MATEFNTRYMATDFDKRYPPDKCDLLAAREEVFVLTVAIHRLGQETSGNARVWRVYRDRANDMDQDVIGGWNKTLDVLLIFVRLDIPQNCNSLTRRRLVCSLQYPLPFLSKCELQSE